MNQDCKSVVEFILKAIMVLAWLLAMRYLWNAEPKWIRTALIAAPYFIKTFKL